MASFEVTIDAINATQAQLEGAFLGGQASYGYPRALMVSYGPYSQVVVAGEQSGPDSHFGALLTQLSGNTTYNWSAQLCSVVGIDASGNYVWGPVSGYSTSGSFRTNAWYPAIAYVYSASDGQWHRCAPTIYSGTSWQAYRAQIYAWGSN